MVKRSKNEEYEEGEEERNWNVKRIGIAFALLLVLGVGAFSLFSAHIDSYLKSRDVLGTSSHSRESANIKLPDVEEVKKTAVKTSQDASDFAMSQVASSRSAVGSFLNNIREVQGGKKNIFDVLCDLFCREKR